MKTIGIIILGFLLPLSLLSQDKVKEEAFTQNSYSQKGTISILSTPELHDLAAQWAADYGHMNPKLKIKLTESDLDRTSPVLDKGIDIGLISKRKDQRFSNESLWNMVIGRDIIVPVMSSKNPFRDRIYQQGISADKFAGLFVSPEQMNWSTLLADGKSAPLHLLIVSDDNIKSEVTAFMGIQPGSFETIKSISPEEVTAALERDHYALVFCEMGDILDDSKRAFNENISLVPIDKNSNGTIDYQEKIYADYDSFTRGVWIGKYPKSLYHNIYAVANDKPDNKAVVSFLKWVSTRGQEELVSIGYSDLVYSEKKSNLEGLYLREALPKNPEKLFTGQKVLALLIGLLVVSGILVNVIASLLVRRRASLELSTRRVFSVFSEDSIKVLNGLYFDKTHTWAFMDQNGTVKIGIDDFLQHVTGPITRVKMKMPGERVNKGDKIMSIIQKGKHLNIYSPVSGVIIEQNSYLSTDSSMINSSPYSDGWVYMVEPTNWLSDIQGLIRGDKYKSWLREEFSRLKDFLAQAIKGKSLSPVPLVLQDGGEIRDSVLAECGPEIWEDFQTNFIDTHK